MQKGFGNYEKELVQACLNQDLKAQEALYKHFYAYAMSVGLRYSYSRDEAVEIVNDSFIKVYKRIGTYDPAYSFKTWLRRIIINTAIDYYRREKKHHQVTDLDAAYHIPDNYEDTISRLTTEDIMKLLNGLPDIQRMVFNLHVIEGYSHQEISESLGISNSTSRSYLTRAKTSLRVLFKKYFEEDYERTLR